MADLNPYPGSPSLAGEAREKVLQTFRHTLDLASATRNEEALLGCDFILKMDPRFQPARKLLEVLRGVAPGTAVDLTPFAEFVSPAKSEAAPARAESPAPSPGAAPAPVPVAAVPSVPVEPVPPAAASSLPASSPSAGLDDLSFDDFGSASTFETAPAPKAQAASAPARPLDLPHPSAPGKKLEELGFGEVPDLAATPSFESPAFDTSFDSPAFEAPNPGFSNEHSPFGASPTVESPPASGGSGAPSPDAPPSMGFSGPGPGQPGPGAGAPPPVDPRVSQFLKQGDDALAKGRVQEAIDLWSRVFLIDLSNDEASRRIDSARDAQAESARKIDMLLSEGIQLFENGDLPSARNRFLDVLAIAESDATARNYLNQVETALANRTSAAEPPPGDPFGRSPNYMQDELEPTRPPAFASDSDLGFGGSDLDSDAGSGTADEPIEPILAGARSKGKVDARIFLGIGALLLAAVGAGAYFLLRSKTPNPVPVAATPVRPLPKAAPVGNPADAPLAEGEPVARAQALFDQGKVEEARTILSAIPDTDPRYPEALALIERLKTTAPPTLASRTQNAATLDELRISGLAAAKANRYIDAVKALDPVTKARPDDTEAAQALTKAREQVAAMGSAVKAFNEQDFESSIKLLWELRKTDSKNQDVEEFLSKSYFDDAIQNLQAGNSTRATQCFQEAVQLRPGDKEAQRHLKFCRKYSKSLTDLVARIYIRHLTPRP